LKCNAKANHEKVMNRRIDGIEELGEKNMLSNEIWLEIKIMNAIYEGK
jgi:hypothetical protein